MTLLRPEALLLIPAVMLLLWLLGWTRRRRRTVVPSLRIWQEAIQRNRRLAFFRNRRLLLSELLAFLALLALALAASRPAQVLSSHQGEDLILICDLSSSMSTTDDGRSYWERSRAQVLSTLAGRKGEDRVALVAPDATGEARLLLPFHGNLQRVEAVLHGLKPFAFPVSLARSFEFGWTMSDQHSGAQVVLLSSRNPARIALDRRISSLASQSFSTVTGRRADRAIRSNVGIVRLEALGGESENTELRLSYTLSNFGSNEAEVSVRRRAGEELQESDPLKISPGASVAGSISVPVSHEGWVSLSLFPEDEFLLDDHASGWVTRFKKKRVGVIASPGKEVDPFLTGAMLACSDWIESADTLTGGPEDVEEIMASADLLVFDGVDPPSGFVPAKPTFWLAVERPAAPLSIQGRVAEPHAAGVKRDHPLLSGLRLDHLHIGEAFWVGDHEVSGVALQGVPGPLILAGESEGQPYVYLAFEPGQSTLPFMSAFPLLIRNALVWFFGDPRSRFLPFQQTGELAHAGEAIGEAEGLKIVSTAPGLTPPRFWMTSPQAARLGLEGASADRRLFVPGLYEWERGSRFVANALHSPPSEPPGSGAEIDPGGKTGKELLEPLELVEHRERWHWFVLAGFVLLLLDWIVFYAARMMRR